MDSVIMTTPTSNTRVLRSRVRSAVNAICARSSKSRSNANRNNFSAKNSRSFYKSHTHNKHVNNNFNRNINNINENNPVTSNNGNKTNLCSFIHGGTVTREVYNAWCNRLGDVTRIPSDSVQALFNDMQLYPSKTQVLEMLQCARQCGRRNTSQFLTFGEFCVFASELKRGGRGRHHNPVQKSIPLSHCEVFLGGSCNPTTWRADIAIPTLSKLGISYYNPQQVSIWSPELMAAEHDAKESASVLLFVCDSQTRCVAGMIEVAHLVAKQRCVVVVVYPFTPGQSIMDEPVTSQEFTDLSEGQSTLLTLVRNQGVNVHNNLSTALQCTVDILRGSNSTTEIAERKLTDKLIKLREVFDASDKSRSGELSLGDVSSAYYQLTNTNLRISDLHSIMNLSANSDPDQVRINFEQFCGIVAEFSTDGCNTTSSINIDDWVNQPLQRQTSANNNSNFEYAPLNGRQNGHQNGDHTNGVHTINGSNHSINSENHINGSHYQQYDVYLGGSCVKKTNWRQNTAIPLLKKYGVTYYNPSLHEKNCENNFHQDLNDNSSLDCEKNVSRNVLNDMNVMDNSKVILFVITNETRSITSMILAAHYIALRKNVVLCIQHLPLENCRIGADVLTRQAIKDYNRARAYLSDLAKHDNIPIFDSVKEAVQCAVNLSQQR